MLRIVLIDRSLRSVNNSNYVGYSTHLAGNAVILAGNLGVDWLTVERFSSKLKGLDYPGISSWPSNAFLTIHQA